MKQLIYCAAFMLISVIVSAQKTDFSGNWNFLDQKSISGTMYSNGVPKLIKITQKKDAINFEKITAGADGNDITANEELDVTGKPFETKSTSGRKKLITLKWDQDGKGFTVTANLYNKDDDKKLEFTYTDKYSMAGASLIMVRKAENFTNGESWESRSNYEKQ